MTDDKNVLETPSELAFDYKLIKLLGEGSYGKTYLAEDLHHGELVAIKALKAVKDHKSLDLFKREAEVLESLSIAGVPRFYKSIIPDNPFVNASYIIQEYVDYPSIQAIMAEKGKFSEADTLHILGKLTNIVNILQTQYHPPVIHRDIKPSNILAQVQQDSDGNDYHVFLIDFGSVSNPQKRSGGSTIAGTFGYMAMEQLQGECTIQSDFYSLGATALHMLTGVAPNMMESKGMALDYRSAIQQYAPGTSENMQELLGWLLETTAVKRPFSASELQMAISQVKLGNHPRMKQDNSSPESFVMPEKIDARNWHYAKGTVWCISVADNELGVGEVVYEYTFEANGRCWMGQMPVKNLSSSSKKPCKCDVRYEPQDPRLNCLISIG